MLYLELLIQGIVQGSLYGLMTLGLTLVYGLLRVLHVAHAGLFTKVVMNYERQIYPLLSLYYLKKSLLLIHFF